MTLFKIAPTVTKYICKKICIKDLSKIAQSGHTGFNYHQIIVTVNKLFKDKQNPLVRVQAMVIFFIKFVQTLSTLKIYYLPIKQSKEAHVWIFLQPSIFNTLIAASVNVLFCYSTCYFYKLSGIWVLVFYSKTERF